MFRRRWLLVYVESSTGLAEKKKFWTFMGALRYKTVWIDHYENLYPRVSLFYRPLGLGQREVKGFSRREERRSSPKGGIG